VNVEFIHVGNPGNPADTRYDEIGFGSVPYEYSIGKYEVTNGQYREFLNAKATVGDPLALFNEEMTSSHGGIERVGAGTVDDPWIYQPKNLDTSWDSRPVNFITFWDAARFVNWLHNGQGDADIESGAYAGIGDESTFHRQSGARFVLPTEDEWYKAAYYDPNKPGGPGYWEYPTRSDDIPTNDAPPGDDFTRGSANYSSSELTPVGAYSAKPSTSAYGTFDQGGNLWEWNETFVIGTYFGLRGGSFDNIYGLEASHRDSYPAFFENRIMGFRVAALPVPEPATLWLAAIAMATTPFAIRVLRRIAR
jgi:formylglycine-generating enzyme required for sulfatase activity